MLRRFSLLLTFIVLFAAAVIAPRRLVSRPAVGPDYTHFESAHVHPACLTPDRSRLLVVNTPDGYLSVFDVTGSGLQRIADIPVGLEPVSVAALDDSTAWVVNNLSDNVSIVNLNHNHVTATIRVGDEPNDVVFAGTPVRAYVSVTQDDRIKVFDPVTLSLDATIPVQGRMPRALAKNADGSLVFVAIFQSGNRTSVLSAAEAADSTWDDFNFPRDTTNKMGYPAPAVGAIVQQFDDGWYDEYGRRWNSAVRYSVLDADVMEITTANNTVNRTFKGVGSINYNLAVSPVDGRLAVVATEARNALRFEPKLSGYMVDTRVSYIATSGTAIFRLLNPHINYTVTPGPQVEQDSAIGIPTGVAWSSNGLRAYVTAFANDRLAVLNPAAGGAAMIRARVPVVAGPTDVIVDDPRGRLYVIGRFHNQVQILSSEDFHSIDIQSIGNDPTPDAIVHGRKFLYGGFTSGHGDQACATCHIFADMDNLAWDLGNPLAPYEAGTPPLEGFDPQKGPMTTQTLRGLSNTDPLHWRGDRANFSAFNGAFMGLMGRTAPLPDSQMAAFGDFATSLVYPPNPHQRLDRGFRDEPIGQPSALRGRNFFMNVAVDTSGTCNSCHTALSFGPGTNKTIVPKAGVLGSQDMKVPQLRNLYKKTGFADFEGAVNKRGFGFSHDGSVDDLFEFLKAPQFTFDADTAIANADRRDLKAFLLAFDTGIAPAVGHQLTFREMLDTLGWARLDTLKGQAGEDYCDLIAWGRVNGQSKGFLYQGTDLWKSDIQAEPSMTTVQLLALASPGNELTVTGVPEGSGERMAHDRDRDSFWNGDERIAGSDPGDYYSTPQNVGVPAGPSSGRFALDRVQPNPFRDRVEMAISIGRGSKADLIVYDVIGREVRVLARGQAFQAGIHRLAWDGRRADGTQASAGVYFVRLRSEAGSSVRPVVRIR